MEVHLPPWLHWLTNIFKPPELADVVKHTTTVDLKQAENKNK